MNDDPFPIACRIYRTLLRCYPKTHRAEYGELMLQLFRDQCRDAFREHGRFGALVVWRDAAGDLVFTAIQEHINNLPNIMKDININRLALILFAIGLGLAFIGVPPLVGTHLATAFIYLSSLAILLRAIAEWFRPPGEVTKSILWGVGVLVAYGFVLPFWAKLHAQFGVPAGFNPALHAIPVLLNIVVPVVKALLSVIRKAS